MNKWAFLLALFCGVALSATPPQMLLAGFSINGKESQNIDALKTDKGYYLPYRLFIQAIGIQPAGRDNLLTFSTPIGQSYLNKEQFITYHQQSYVALKDLKALGVTATFKQSDYAIHLYVPWDTKNPIKKTSKKQSEIIIDYYPQSVGLNELSINGEWSRQENKKNGENSDASTRKQITVGASGNLSGGIWGAKFRYEQNGSNHNQVIGENLYWTIMTEQYAMRLGVNQPSYNAGSNNEFSGVSVAYSNRSITRHLSALNSNTQQLLKNTYQDYRTISGEGPAGGIAELRVNGRAIARVRIALDKRYEFKNLDLNQLHDNEYNVEIALYEYNLANQPLKVEPLYLGKRRANVGTGELLLEGGFGQLGNVLDKDRQQTNHHYAYAYAEYGLSNNIAVRLGLSDNGDLSTMAGVNIGLSQSLNWDIAWWDNKAERRYRTWLEYSLNNFTLNYHFNYLDKDNGITEKRQSLYAYYRPADWLNFSLGAYRNRYSNKADEDYFTASVNARLTPQLNVQVNRDRDDQYSYRINWNAEQWNSHFSFTGDEEKNGFYARYRLSKETDIGLDLARRHNSSQLFSQIYTTHDFNENNRLYLAYNHYRSQSGFQVDWRYRVNKGMNIYLGYRKNNVGLDIDDSIISNDNYVNDSSYAYLRFDMSLTKTPNSGLHFNPYNYTNNGAILADIRYDDDIPLNDEEIALQLNRYSVKAEKLANGKYLINNIKPGVYQLRLDDRNLPIEYNTNNLPKPMVKVANAATTVVPYHLRKSLGISGKVEHANANTVITVYQGDTAITKTRANSFGYYQLTGLKPGTYQIKADGYQTITVKLDKTYLFEVDLRRIK